MWSALLAWAAVGALFSRVLANDILKTDGFTTCIDKSAIKVQKLDISFDRVTNKIVFDVAGVSAKEQKVMASLSVSAYGKKVYSKDFNPCDDSTKVDRLCPVPVGNFAATGQQDVPPQFANQIPSIAFNVPDLEGQAKLELKAIEGGQNLACIESGVVNGKTMDVPAVSYITAGIAACALLFSALSTVANAGATGSHAPAVGFGTVVTWFQGVAMNGMMSVQYPPVYQHFTKNFAFAGGLVSWKGMQTSIDGFRKATGGNLTENSVLYLGNVSLVHTSGPKHDPSINAKRGLDLAFPAFQPNLMSRDTAININGNQAGNGTTASNSNATHSNPKINHFVHGIQGYVEQLTIPQANTFMTVLLVFAIVIASIAVSILLFKVILETWALFASFPKKLRGFRKRYWGLLGRTITNLILLLYGVWTLYCVFQFTNGDSWAAKVLAGITLAIFTALLGFFTFRIWQLAQRFKRIEGDTSALFEDKETWRKYSLFYDNYKRGYWWLFMPAIVYMFAKGCVIAGGNGHGLTQTAGQLIVESLMLILVLWCRPFVSTSGNWINIFIQVVRVLSVACILVFVEELGISQSTKTITGVILIAVQSGLTGLLAILIAVNAIVVCVRQNPHRKQRKEAEKLHRDLDALTPLSPRNTFLMDSGDSKDEQATVRAYLVDRDSSGSLRPYSESLPPVGRMHARPAMGESSEYLISNAVPVGFKSQQHERSISRDSSRNSRKPTVPNVGQAM